MAKKAKTEFGAQKHMPLARYTFCGQGFALHRKKTHYPWTQLQALPMARNPPEPLKVEAHFYALRMETLGPIQRPRSVPLMPFEAETCLV